jgi:hypothetical protein
MRGAGLFGGSGWGLVGWAWCSEDALGLVEMGCFVCNDFEDEGELFFEAVDLLVTLLDLGLSAPSLLMSLVVVEVTLDAPGFV